MDQELNTLSGRKPVPTTWHFGRHGVAAGGCRLFCHVAPAKWPMSGYDIETR